jgi:hypothetical protein
MIPIKIGVFCRNLFGRTLFLQPMHQQVYLFVGLGQSLYGPLVKILAKDGFG